MAKTIHETKIFAVVFFTNHLKLVNSIPASLNTEPLIVHFLEHIFNTYILNFIFVNEMMVC